MADVSKIKLPNNSVVNIKDARITGVDTTPTSGSSNVVESGGIKEAIMESAGEVIIGTQTAATGNWTGVSKLATASDMKSGYRFTYWLPYAGSGNATLTLTFQDGTTKAINCYIRGASRLTTHIPAGNKIDFCYLENASVAGTSYTGAWIDPGYWDGNTYDRIYSNYERRFIYSTSAPLYRYKICGYNDGKIVPLTITNQTSSTIIDKQPVSIGIDPSMGLCVYNTTTNITDISTAMGSIYDELPISFCQYTFNDNVPAYKDVYLKGTIGEDGLFYLDTTTHKSWYVFAPNRESDGEYNSVFESGSYYMLVGPTYSSANYFQLKYNNPVYLFNGERLVTLEEVKFSEVKEGTEFLYRKSPSITQGYYSAKEIKGKTLVWNQLVHDGNFPNETDKWTSNTAEALSISGNTAHVSATSTPNASAGFQPQLYEKSGYWHEITIGHKYLLSFMAKLGSDSALVSLNFRYGSYAMAYNLSTSWSRIDRVITANDASSYLLFWQYVAASSSVYTADFYIKDVRVFDLTLMFGAGNEPATVEEFESMFPLPYYDYNPGELISFNATGIQTVGRNLVDINTFPELTGKGEIDANGAWHLSSLSVGVTLWKNTVGYTGRLYYEYSAKYANGGNKGAGQRFKFVYTDGTSSTGVHSSIGKVVESFQTDYGSSIESWISDVFLYFLTDPQTDGTDGYIPYKSSTLNLSIPSMTSGGVQIFPNGMRSAGSVSDSAVVDSDGYIRKVTKRIGDVDLGTLTYNTNLGSGWFQSAITGAKNLSTVKICSKYVYVDGGRSSTDKTVSVWNETNYPNVLAIKDSAYSDTAAFKSAMSGVMLYYELATPVEYALDNPIFVGTEYYSGGIQKVLPENTSEPTTAPFRGKFGYRDYSYAEKQDKLTFDTTPTANSANPVTSGGIYTELADVIRQRDMVRLTTTEITNLLNM